MMVTGKRKLRSIMSLHIRVTGMVYISLKFIKTQTHPQNFLPGLGLPGSGK